MRGIVVVWAILAGAVVFDATAPACADGVIPGYSDYADYARRIAALDSLDSATVRSIAKTLGEKEVFLATIGEEDIERKPAILIVGNVVTSHLVGSELALGIAESIAKKAGDEKIKSLLDQVTIYIIPRPNPDGCERFFDSPYFDVDGNSRKTDDDRDFLFGEDPPEDLNKDGFITQMRVADPVGDQISHPDNPRVLIPADAKKGENGQYRVYLEGVDNDHDEKWNEDPGAGVSFNRNYPAKYPYFGEHAGPNAVSELESRAIADFLFDHPNIVAVLSFSPEDNLFHPWKAANDAASQKVKTSIQPDDTSLMDSLAERYREIHGGKECPASPGGTGSFSDWAYLQYGRWSFAARAWWIPPAEKPKDKDDKPKGDEEKKDDAKKDTDEKKDAEVGKEEKPKKKKEDDRAKDMRRALQWFADNNISGFSEWTAIDHPDFPGKKVEVGGIRPFFLLNPPSDQFTSLIDKHVQFVSVIAEKLPKLAIHDTKVEPAGSGVFRITLRVVNEGFLPTMSKMGEISRIPRPLNWEIELDDSAKLLSGTRRGQIGVLAGSGGNTKLEWLLVAPGDKPKASFVVRSPSVGEVRTELILTAK